MFTAKNLHLSFGAKTILDNISLTLLAKEKIALVGHNGTGKSSLMEVLAGAYEPDAGSLEFSKHTRIGILRQTPSLDDNLTVAQAVKTAIKDHINNINQHQRLCHELQHISAEDERQNQLKIIASLAHKIEHHGGFDVDYQIARVLSRLNIKNLDQKIGTLSGGEKRRVDLARVLLQAPDVYLLDEPTNHLDLAAIEYLVSFFKATDSAVLFVSHDTAFIDELATRILELSMGKIYSHEPPFANYLESKLTRELIDGRFLHRRERLVVGELAWLRAGTKARTTKQNARIDRAHELIDSVAKDIKEQREKKLNAITAQSLRLGKTILELHNVSASFGDSVLFKDVNLKLSLKHRYGILGPNGAGKTTLLSIIAQKIAPTSGHVVLGKNTKIIEFDQHRKKLDDELTLKETIADHGDYVFVGEKKFHIASYLEKYLFSPDDHNRKVATLSGGEKNRLLMAKFFKHESNCLLLDEPTNDLDVTSLSVLEEILLDYQGVIFVVSHDRRFLDKVCNGIIAFEPLELSGTKEHNITIYQGNYSTYQSLKSQKEHNVKIINQIEVKKNIKEKPKKRNYKEEQEFLQIESLIESLEDKRNQLQEELCDPSKYNLDGQAIKEKATLLAKLEITIENTYNRWQQLIDISQ